MGAYLTDSSQREEKGHGSGSREIRPLYHCSLGFKSWTSGSSMGEYLEEVLSGSVWDKMEEI